MKWFRPCLVVCLILSVVVGFFVKLIDGQAFFGFATGLVVYWFKSRDEDKIADNTSSTTTTTSETKGGNP